MNQDHSVPLGLRIAVGISADRLLSSNLAALSACDLDFAKQVAQAKPEPSTEKVVVRPSESGWPTVVWGALHLHSARDPIAEAQVQARRAPPDAARIMVLGFGAGHLLAVLLTRPQVARLDVVPLNPWVLHEIARSVDLKPLLCDPRVRLSSEERRLAEPFVAVPPLLRLTPPSRQGLRDAALGALLASAGPKQGPILGRQAGAAAVAAELRRLAHLLRTGGESVALPALDTTISLVGAQAGAVAEWSAALQALAACQARSDLIGLADVLEHDLARALSEGAADPVGGAGQAVVQGDLGVPA